MPQRNILNKVVNMSDILQADDFLVRTTSITGPMIAVDYREAIYKQKEKKLFFYALVKMSKRARISKSIKGDQRQIAKREKDVFRRFHNNSHYDPDAMHIQWQGCRKDSSAMQIQWQGSIKDSDAMQIEYIPQSIHESVTSKKEEEMRHILNYLQSTRGQLNRLLKYNRRDPEMNRCDRSSTQSPYACPLSSQCYSTTLLVNYLFGNPNRVSRKLRIITHGEPEFSINADRITDYIRRNLAEDEIMNMEISVPSTTGTFFFPGHVFNILFLKQRGKIFAFVVQSFIYSYTFFYNEISLGVKDDKSQSSITKLTCCDILKFYIEMFQTNCSKPFSARENIIWKYLTNNYLQDYDGNSLVGSVKPQGMSIVLGTMKCNNLVLTVQQKYKKLLRQTYSKLEVYQKDLVKNRNHKGPPSKALRQKRRVYQESFGSTNKLGSWKRKIQQAINIQQKT